MFADCSSEAEVQHWMRYNIFLLLDVGTFSALVELLNMEIEYVLTVVIHRIPYNIRFQGQLSQWGRTDQNGQKVDQLILYCIFLSVTVLPVAVLSENQPSRWLTALISECCSTSCTWWWKRYSRMIRLTSPNGKSSEKRSELNWVGLSPHLFYGSTQNT